MALNESIATRESLLSRLRNWDEHESWREFFETYWRLIYSQAIRDGLNQSEAEEVVQEVTLELAKRLKEFKYDANRGSFKAWLRQLTRWRVQDQLRKRREHVSLDHPGSASEAPLPSELVAETGENPNDPWEEEWQQNLMAAAIQNLRRDLPPKQFQVFDLLILRESAPAQVARAVGISTAQVYVIKFRVVSALKKEVRRLGKDLI